LKAALGYRLAPSDLTLDDFDSDLFDGMWGCTPVGIDNWHACFDISFLRGVKRSFCFSVSCFRGGSRILRGGSLPHGSATVFYGLHFDASIVA